MKKILSLMLLTVLTMVTFGARAMFLASEREEAPMWEDPVLTYNYNVVKVDFVYGTNANKIAKDAGGTAVWPASCVSVNVDGEDVEIESVELQGWNFYIFITEDIELTEDNVVKVSFINPGELVYTSDECPDGNGSVVRNFETLDAVYDEMLDAVSVSYNEAVLVSSIPAQESFEMPADLNEFSFTYDRLIYTSDGNEPEAILTGAGGINETLVVKEGQELLSNTIVFLRPDNTPLADGDYQITVSGILNSKCVVSSKDDILYFSVGEVKVASTIITMLGSAMPAAIANSVPTGWTVNNEGEMRNGDDEKKYDSGPRVFCLGQGGQLDCMLYFRAKNNTEGWVQYGDVEGYEIELPAFPAIQFTTYGFSWKKSGHVLRTVVSDLETGEVLTEYSGTTTASINGNLNAIVTPDKFCGRIKDYKGGKVVVRVYSDAQTGSWDEVCCGGFAWAKIEETEGDKAEGEVIVEEDFADVLDSYTPEAGRGWTIWEKGEAKEKGVKVSQCARMMKFTNAAPLKTAFYNRNLTGEAEKYYLTYGEGDEPALMLENRKYLFSYHAACWKNPSHAATFELIDYNTGNVVLSRKDSVRANLNSKADAAITPDRIQFTALVPKAGRYIMKFYATGETVIGAVKVESVGSLSVYYKNLLADALLAATEEREVAEGDLYDCDTRNQLDALIEEVRKNAAHSAGECTAKATRLESLTAALKERRSNALAYSNILNNAANAISKYYDTRYEALEQFEQLQQLYDKYVEREISSISDNELASVVATMEETHDALNSMASTGVGLLTRQIASLTAAILQYDDELEEMPDVMIAAGDVVSDNQDIVSQLKTLLTAAIYTQCAKGNPFEYEDDEWGMVQDSIDMTCYIQNASFYTRSTDREVKTGDELPGWTFQTEQGTPAMCTNWGTNVMATATKPVSDAYLLAASGVAFCVAQQVEGLPVGIYTVGLNTLDRNAVNSNDTSNPLETSCCVVINGIKNPFCLDNMLDTWNLSAFRQAGVKIVENTNKTGKLDFGISFMSNRGGTAKADDAQLYMTAPLPGFDYAAAAAALREQIIADGIQAVVKRTDAPVSIQWFDLSGRATSHPQGTCITVKRYADGYMTVSKNVLK